MQQEAESELYQSSQSQSSSLKNRLIILHQSIQQEAITDLVDLYVSDTLVEQEPNYNQIQILIEYELKKWDRSQFKLASLHFEQLVLCKNNVIISQHLRNHEVMDHTKTDFINELGEDFYRKLITHGSTGLLGEKIEDSWFRRYDYSHWVQHNIEMQVGQVDGLHLQLLKNVWDFKFKEALMVVDKIKISDKEDSQICSLEVGIKMMKEAQDMVVDNEEIKEIFMERKKFEIEVCFDNHDNTEIIDFKHKVNEIQQHLTFGAMYFQRISQTIKNPFYKAVSLFLDNNKDNHTKDNDQICEIEEISIVDRYFYCKKFFKTEEFESWKNRVSQNHGGYYALDYIFFFGTRKETEVIIQNYVDETNDSEKAAIISVFLKIFIEQQKLPLSTLKENKLVVYNKFIKNYEYVLSRLDEGISKLKFDQKCIKIEIERKRKTLNKTFSFNCINCKSSQNLQSISKRISIDLKLPQIKMKGNSYFSKDFRSQICYCVDCMHMMPKCSVCMFPVAVFNGYAEELKKNYKVGNQKQKHLGENLSTALVWCPKCFHGGHFSHIIKWMKINQKRCPNPKCKCRCEF